MVVIRTSQQTIFSKLHDKNIVLAIGVFDGVHLGHRYLIQQLQILAEELLSESAVFTFWPYPHHGDKKILYPLERKYKVLHSLGVKYIIEQRFDASFSALNADEFFTYLLKQIPKLRGICVGADFHFGYKRSGNINTLQNLCSTYGIVCEIVKKYLVDNQEVSSSRIRRFIDKKDFGSANFLLGEKYF